MASHRRGCLPRGIAARRSPGRDGPHKIAAEDGTSHGFGSMIPARLRIPLHTPAHATRFTATSPGPRARPGRARVVPHRPRRRVRSSTSCAACARDDYESHLWTRPLRGGRRAPADPRPRSRRSAGHLARWTPAGLRALRQSGTTSHPQAWVLPLDGGEPWQLTTLKHGVAERQLEPGRASAGARRTGRRPSFHVGEGGPGRRRPPAASRGSTSATTSRGTSIAAATCGSCRSAPEPRRAS